MAPRKAAAASPRRPATIRRPDGGNMMPLDFMLDLLRDEEAALEDRKWAAYHAAPYCHARLSTVDRASEVTISHEDALELLA